MIRAIVCDDEKAAHTLISYFESTNVCPLKIVGHAYNGAEALDMIRREKPNLVFMDINMPFLDGFEVIEKLPDCKVIIITAYDSFSYAQRALRLGACDILAKPVDFEQLKNAVERAIGHQFTENQWLNQVISYIYEHYMEQLELSVLAGIACVSESHLAREFKKATGRTMISFVHKVRIEKSVFYMTVEKKSIKDTMELVGYQNMNQFYKYFEREMGMTPAAYMKK
ncbi:MAG: response regulator [Blautia sp.]|nr:response regulator [Blautia sp.]